MYPYFRKPPYGKIWIWSGLKKWGIPTNNAIKIAICYEIAKAIFEKNDRTPITGLGIINNAQTALCSWISLGTTSMSYSCLAENHMR